MLYYLVDALPALLGSMATLWAVCSPRHWFVRSCFIAALLLLFLLIPAYELLVAGVVQIAIIFGGIRWWRKRSNSAAAAESTDQRFRISLRNLLLLTVLAAVAMAVLANFPDSPWLYWLRWAGPGVGVGCVTLFAEWLATSNKRRFIRWPAAIGFVLLAAAVNTFVQVLSWATRGWTNISTEVIPYLYAPDSLKWAGQLALHYLPVNAIGLGLMWLWIYLFVKSGWFDPFGDAKFANIAPSKSTTTFVRALWIVLTVAIAFLPVTLLVKLALPREQPEFGGLKPARFKLLYEAGSMLDDAEIAALNRARRSSGTDDLAREIAAHSDVTALMKEAFEKPTAGPRIVGEDNVEPARLMRLLTFREILAEKIKSADMQSEIWLDHTKLWDMFYLDATATHAAILSGGDARIMQGFWNLWDQLVVDQHSEILLTVSALEHAREEWPILLQRQRIEDENAGWESHLHVILDDWLGKERYTDEHVQYLTNRTKIRLILVDLAITTYLEANGSLPVVLGDLVPNVLSELPTDPYSQVPLQYLRTDDAYILYSVGHNGVDDGGEGDDLLFDVLMQPATPTVP